MDSPEYKKLKAALDERKLKFNKSLERCRRALEQYEIIEACESVTDNEREE